MPSPFASRPQRIPSSDLVLDHRRFSNFSGPQLSLPQHSLLYACPEQEILKRTVAALEAATWALCFGRVTCAIHGEPLASCHCAFLATHSRLPFFHLHSTFPDPVSSVFVSVDSEDIQV